MEITPIVYRQFSANTYLIGTKGGEVLVIDPGLDSDSLVNLLNENYSGVTAVLLTHGHYDHISGVDRVVKAFKCPVYIHEGDVEFLSTPRLNGSYKSDTPIKSAIQPITFGGDYEFSLLGLKIRAIHTPFHTQGSVCYLFTSLNAIFTGDTLFRGDIGRTDLPGSSEKTVEPSLKKLRVLSPMLIVYPGHGHQTTIERELSYNRYFHQ